MLATNIPMKHSPLKLCFLLAAGLVVSACNNRDSDTNGRDITGEYALVATNGNKLPADITLEGTTLKVRSGTLTLNADGTCTSETIFITPPGDEVTRQGKATYTKEGSKLDILWKGDVASVGTIEGNTLSVDGGGMLLEYKK